MTKNKSYKVLQAELDNVLEELQSNELDIDKSMELYNKGQELISELEDYLKKSKNEIIQIKK